MGIEMDATLDRLWSLRVRDVMSPHVEALRGSQNMVDAANVFSEHHISGAPVTDEDGKCEGVLSVFDFVRHRERSEDHVAVHMTRPAKTVDADAPILTAARIMCEQHIHRLIVVDDNGRPIATVSSLDLVSAMTNAMEESTL